MNDLHKNVSIQLYSMISTGVIYKMINVNYYYSLKSKLTSTKTALCLTHKNDCDLDHMSSFFLKTNMITKQLSWMLMDFFSLATWFCFFF
jgi:hypothetical protein